MFAFIEKYIIIALIVVAVILGGLYLWQRNTVIKQAGQITNLTVEVAGLQGQVSDYKAGVEAAKKADAAKQKVIADMSKLLRDAQSITSKCEMEEKDEETISAAVYYFNNGILPPTASADKSGQVLPKTGQTRIDRPHWTLQQIIINHNLLIQYVSELEKGTVSCYESQK